MSTIHRLAAVAVLWAIAVAALAVQGENVNPPLLPEAWGEAAEAVEVRIAVQRLEDGRTELALQILTEGGWGDRVLPGGRYLPARYQGGRWSDSAPLGLDSGHTVRVSARLLDDGRIELALQQRRQGVWGERILPLARKLPADAPVNRWLPSSALELQAITPPPTYVPLVNVAQRINLAQEGGTLQYSAEQTKDGTVNTTIETGVVVEGALQGVLRLHQRCDNSERLTLTFDHLPLIFDDTVEVLLTIDDEPARTEIWHVRSSGDRSSAESPAPRELFAELRRASTLTAQLGGLPAADFEVTRLLRSPLQENIDHCGNYVPGETRDVGYVPLVNAQGKTDAGVSYRATPVRGNVSSYATLISDGAEEDRLWLYLYCWSALGLNLQNLPEVDGDSITLTMRIDDAPQSAADWTYRYSAQRQSGAAWLTDLHVLFPMLRDGSSFTVEAAEHGVGPVTFDLVRLFDTPVQGNLDHCGMYRPGETREPGEEVDERPAETPAPSPSGLHLWNRNGGNPRGLHHWLFAPVERDAGAPLHLILYLSGRSEPDGEPHSISPDLLDQLADRHGVALLTPNWLADSRVWNLADGSEAGDHDPITAYLELIGEVRELIEVDRISIVGEYAGGWMAYRLACEGVPGLSAIAVLEASSYGDLTRCDGSRPISVLHVHAQNYKLWRYLWPGGERLGTNGGVFTYPSAQDLVQAWANRAGCDLDAAVAADTLDERGDDVFRLKYASGCEDGLAVELWGIPAHEDLLPSLLSERHGAGLLAWLDTQAQTRDLDELLQPGAEPAPRPQQLGVWTREGRLEFMVLATDPPATLVRPAGIDPDLHLPIVLPLPGSHNDVWHDAAKWVGEVGKDHQFAVLLPSYDYRKVPPHQPLHSYTELRRTRLLESMFHLATAQLNAQGLFLSGDSGGAFDVFWAARRCLNGLTAVIARSPSLDASLSAFGCENPEPVSVLYRYGTEDHPWAATADNDIRSWADLAGCLPEPAQLPNIDVDGGIPGAETEVLRWQSGCAEDVIVELWRAVGAGHNPWNPNLGAQLVEWMIEQSRIAAGDAAPETASP
ncbi:MAG: hypothetical protein F4X58_13285 [Chloroflexi bacterium]|nr:hypothetical protein [Chloroflexota bacterium]